MNFLFSSNFVLITLFIHQLMSAQVLSCKTHSRVDAISYLYYKGIAFVLTSNGYYYVIKEEDIDNKDVLQFEPAGRIPYLTKCCDSAFVKDVNECKNENDNEHSVTFLKFLSSDTTKYLKLNITSLLSDEPNDGSLWSEPKPLSTDVILSDINIDYSKPIDAIFNTDNNGEVFFIQGEFYSGIEFHESCPQNKDSIKVYGRRKLSELKVFGHIDSAYFEPNVENPILYLTNYDNMRIFKVIIDSTNSVSGKLVSLDTSVMAIEYHPVFSRICASDINNRYNSSHLSADEPIIGIQSNGSVAHSLSILSLLLTFIFYFSFI